MTSGSFAVREETGWYRGLWLPHWLTSIGSSTLKAINHIGHRRPLWIRRFSKEAVLATETINYIGHDHIGHNYMGHEYMGHTNIGQPGFFLYTSMCMPQ